LLKISDIIGLPIIITTNGEKIGIVQEILLNLSRGAITGFILDKGGFLRDKKIVDIKEIKNIGEGAIIIDKEDIKFENDLKSFDDSINFKEMMNKPVFTQSGKNLGIIGDIFVNENNGHIIGFEVSEGIIHDILEGRGIIPLPRSTIYGKDTIVVPNYVVDFFEKNATKKDLLLQRLSKLEQVWEKAEAGADYWSNVEQY
jgi:uncharacterized protein YrrD